MYLLCNCMVFSQMILHPSKLFGLHTSLNHWLSPITTRRGIHNIVIKKIGPITCIGLNRPEKKNCLNLDMIKELQDAVESFEKDNSSAAAVLYGERGTFSYGYDADEYSTDPKMKEEIDDTGLLGKYPLKPIVAAISGHALGPGFDLALWCDFRVVEDTALLGGYARKLGIPGSEDMIQRMYSLLGLNKALDLMLTGRIMTAQEALQSGVATRLVACGSGLGQAVTLAHTLSNAPQACMKADRAALISLSGKYSPAVTQLIQEEMLLQRRIAFKEAEECLHDTGAGDGQEKN